MRLERNPELLDRLAADYLTGGMAPGARRRFETLLRTQPVAAQSLQRWRERLEQGLLPEHTPQRVWQAVQQRLEPAAADSAAMRGARAWGLRAWRALALGMGGLAVAAGALVLALLLQRPALPPAGQPAQLVAVLAGPAGHAALLHVRGAQASLTAIGEQAAPQGKSFELWVLPAQGKPIAAGVVQLHGTFRMPMPPTLLAAALRARGFAISVEPQGGSPTGQPTGPVTYVGRQVASAGAPAEG